MSLLLNAIGALQLADHLLLSGYRFLTHDWLKVLFNFLVVKRIFVFSSIFSLLRQSVFLVTALTFRFGVKDSLKIFEGKVLFVFSLVV